MYCSNCGKQVNENEKFCSECGKMLAGSAQSETVKSAESPVVKNNKGVIIGLCAVIAILTLCIVLIFASGAVPGKDSEKADVSISAEVSEKETTEKATTEKETTEKKETTTKKADTAVTNTTSKPKDNNGVVAPDYYSAEGYYYVKPEEGLYLRKGPGKNYDEITLLDEGVCVQYNGKSYDAPGWYYVTVKNSTISGWVSADYLSTTKTDSSMINKYYSYNQSFSARVADREGLNLRSGASTSSYVYDVIPKDKTVTVWGYSAYDSAWLYVSVYLDGRTLYGFVKSEYLAF